MHDDSRIFLCLTTLTVSPQLYIVRIVHYFAFPPVKFHLSRCHLNGLVCLSPHSVENQYISPTCRIAKIPDVYPQETYGMQDLQAVCTFCISFI